MGQRRHLYAKVAGVVKFEDKGRLGRFINILVPSTN